MCMTIILKQEAYQDIYLTALFSYIYFDFVKILEISGIQGRPQDFRWQGLESPEICITLPLPNFTPYTVIQLHFKLQYLILNLKLSNKIVVLLCLAIYWFNSCCEGEIQGTLYASGSLPRESFHHSSTDLLKTDHIKILTNFGPDIFILSIINVKKLEIPSILV